ncbi:MAG: hypothetical protein LBQ82_05400 [Treponema sp.]|jgi:hypothetical protein|nr:hypothetical protein [Treponema sp.]
MRNTIKTAAKFGLFSMLFFTVVSCDKLDTVGNYSIRSFSELLSNAPQLVSEDAVNGGWSFAAPDGSARFIWSGNFAASPLFDVMIETDAIPFIAAGLDPAQLPDNFYFDSKSNLLVVGTKLGTEQLQYNGEVTPLASYRQIVKLKRGSIGYHGAMDHYGINLGDGNLFEWAKDLNTNDKDIVFVLNPEPFIRAGVDPDRIEGWTFARVPVEDEKGRMIEADKILKPFDLL